MPSSCADPDACPQLGYCGFPDQGPIALARSEIRLGLVVSYGAQMSGHEALITLHHKLPSAIGLQPFSMFTWIFNAFSEVL
jgi:hypothetical protein